MQRRGAVFVVWLTLLVAMATSCAGVRPTLTDAATPSTTTPNASVDETNGKIATLDPNATNTSVVAQAKVGSVAIYDSPTANKVTRTLANPNANGAPLVFLVDASQNGRLKVLLPIRPNGSTGWIRASDVTLSRHNYSIEVRLAEFRIIVKRGTTVVLDAPIGVAKDNSPTPGGRYYTTELLKPPDPNSVYGTYAYGLSGYSETFTTFNGGPGQLGIHGTNDPATIGTKVSSGCVRLRNADIEKLAAMLPLGVPVQIVK